MLFENMCVDKGGFYRHFQQYSSYIVVVSEKTTDLFQTDISHNVVSSTARHERGSNSQLQWWYALIAQVVVNQTTIRYHDHPW